MEASKEYEPYGPEWGAHLMKLPKKFIIELYRASCQKRADHIPDTGKMGFEQWQKTKEYDNLMAAFNIFQCKIDDLMKVAYEAGQKNK